MKSPIKSERLPVVNEVGLWALQIRKGSRIRRALLDTCGEGRGQEGYQLFATGIRERLGAEHVIHDRESCELCHDHDGPDRGVVAADLRGEERQLGAVEVPPKKLDGAGRRGGVQEEQERRQDPVPCVAPSVYDEPGEMGGQVVPLTLEREPHVKGAPNHLGEEPLLGAEVAVDERGGHAGVRGDLADPRAFVALGGEAVCGRLEDRRAGRDGIPLPSRS